MSLQRISRQRRDNGDGSLYFDEAKQRWVGQLDLGSDATGRRIRPRVSAKTKTEARTRLDVLRHAHGAGQDVRQSSQDRNREAT